jgi:hypothetical protein
MQSVDREVMIDFYEAILSTYREKNLGFCGGDRLHGLMMKHKM